MVNLIFCIFAKNIVDLNSPRNMKRFFAILLIVLLATNVFAQEEVLTNETILEMVGLGFSDEIIISKIDECPNTFDTSIDALKVLKQNNVSENVIVYMVSAAKKRKMAISENENAKEGIYYVDSNGQEHEILPSVISGTKYSEGLITDKVYAIIPYPTSPNVINEQSPKFVFYFNKSAQGSNFSSGVDNWWFKVASSPNEFVLVEMIKKKNNRRLQIGETGAFDPTITSGVNNGKAIPFSIKKISESKYEVIIQDKLKIGEYCFIYQGNMPRGGNNQSVFDFSIQSVDGKNAKGKKSKRNDDTNYDDIYSNED